MYHYSYRVFWHEPDKAYFAVVDGVPEFRYISASGDTPEEAVRELGIALEAVFEDYREEGRELPEPQVVAQAG
ncbi:MAG TPA: type II toxin-antitoxin system HicB family antitoxin [Ardenticatenaceae bacterium]|jgi:predicted RNase H-like HicB family nuclease